MCMTKTNSKETYSPSYRNAHDENPYTRKWIVIRTNMCSTKTFMAQLSEIAGQKSQKNV